MRGLPSLDHNPVLEIPTDYQRFAMTRLPPATSFAAVLHRRYTRRGFLSVSGTVAAAVAVSNWNAPALASARRTAFTPVAPSKADRIELPQNYTHDIIARWGDSLFRGTPGLKPEQIATAHMWSAEAADQQTRQFGTNCDGLGYFPISGERSDRGILCVNNEYVQAELTFSGRTSINKDTPENRRRWIQEHPHAVALMKAAQGVSVIEVERRRGQWRLRAQSPFARRIMAETPMLITGPAAGSAWLRTKADPSGTRSFGTMANCASGKTPWGTYLTCEENVDDYFGNARTWAASTDEKEIVEVYRRWPIREHSYYGWEHVDPRFDMRAEPREALRFGWIVEIDPRDPKSTPRKRTALGRFSHECANTMIARDGRVAAYMGDDDQFEYVYKFVTRGKFDPRNPAANRDLLDEGTLYVARFDADGTGEWLPLVYDEKGPLNSKTGFTSQADVVVKARAAADLLGATPMDRPEDIQPSQADGRVYISCTNNRAREAQSRMAEKFGRIIDVGPNPANPRGANRTGHIIELTEQDGDAAATRFEWNVFLLAGKPNGEGSRLLTRYEDVATAQPTDTWYAGFGEAEALSQIACPDNLGLDPSGRLWIVTDSHYALDANDGCYVCERTGPQRGALRQIMSAPVGAEVCGCEFTPDGTTVFLSIQHPGEGGSIDEPISHWPDGGLFPGRSSVIALRREDGDPL